jgi:hypothetical protein
MPFDKMKAAAAAMKPKDLMKKKIKEKIKAKLKSPKAPAKPAAPFKAKY